MKKSLLFAMLAISMNAFAQSPDWLWAKSIGGTDDETGISTVDASGNIFTTGSFKGIIDFDPGPGTFNLTSAGGSDIFITKTDATGNFVWAKRIGGVTDDAGTAITVDTVGNVYITGHFTGTADFDPGTGIFNITSAGYDTFISKFDNQGNFVWAKSMGGTTSNDVADCFSIALDPSENIITAGGFIGTIDFNPGVETFNITSASSDASIFISKLDNQGNFLWAKVFQSTSGSYAVNVANSAVTDGLGNVYTACYIEEIVDFDPGIGIFNLTPQAGGVISKLDSSGNFVWAKQMDKTEIKSLAIDASNNVYSTGFFSDTVDFDPGAGIFNLSSAGSEDIFISKLNSSGDFVFAKGFGGIGYDEGTSIALDNDGNIYTTGDFGGTADFDPGSASFNLSSKGSGDIFISKLDNLGNFVWAKAAGGTGFGWSRSIALDALGNMYLSGGFGVPSISFGSITLTNAENSGYNHDIFIAKFGDKTTGIEKVVKRDNTFSVFPNPTNGRFTINNNSTINSVEIYNLLGARIPTEIKLNQQTSCEIDLSGQPKGIYLVKIMTGTKSSSRKIVLQ